MQSAFEKAIKDAFFKSKSMVEIQRIAIETVELIEGNTKKVEAALSSELKGSQSLCNKLREFIERQNEKIATLQNKMDGIIEAGNTARKHASARANRYKSKHEHLLDSIERVLPGAKELLTSKAIAHDEKIGKLKHLDGEIKKQQQRVQDRIAFDYRKRRDDFLSGYGKQCCILESLLARRERIKAQKSY